MDTGVDASHPDLAGRIIAGNSSISGNPNTDPNGHGTALAGIAAADVNNAAGMAGVAYSDTKIMPVQVLKADGTGYDSDVIAGVIWADAIAYASGSNTGSALVAAPGTNIYTTQPGGSYGSVSGTSAASAHVAGLAALLAANGKSNSYIFDQIRSTTDPIGQSFGRINVVKALGGAVTSVPTPVVTATPTPGPVPTYIVAASTDLPLRSDFVTTIYTGTSSRTINTATGNSPFTENFNLGSAGTDSVTCDFYSAPLTSAGPALAANDNGQVSICVRNNNPSGSGVSFRVSVGKTFYDYNPATGAETQIVNAGMSDCGNLAAQDTRRCQSQNTQLSSAYTVPTGHLLKVKVTIQRVSGMVDGTFIYNDNVGGNGAGSKSIASLPSTKNANWNFGKYTPTATLAVSNSPQTYTGSGQAATVSISASSVTGAVANILTGGAATQTNADTCAVTADFAPTDATNYNSLAGASAGNFVISDASKPTVLNLNPNPAPFGSSIVITATVSDAESGNSKIVSAEYSINGGTYTYMNAVDGYFDSATESVKTPVISSLSVGVYNVCVRGTDEKNNVAEPECVLLAVYDPSAGFVTGGGWINSPAGASTAYASAIGKANFGFASKYQKDAKVPTGETEFQFKAGNLNFHSSTYEWLVVSGARAQYRGAGTINGAGNYGFLLTAIDSQINGGGNVDKFRIKIWDVASGSIVYDNQMDATDTADPTTAISGGSIVIHTK
jgi:hypothetical protein